jgi:CelD/BcsL family acetyltransferase involved in cellulose biosynthesis
MAAQDRRSQRDGEDARALPLQGHLHSIDDQSDFESLTTGWHASGFQQAHWLRCWFATIGIEPGIEGFWLTLKDSVGQDVLAMPVIRHVEARLTRLTSANLGVTDYNAPLLMPRAALYTPGEIWAAIRATLPRADLLQIDHMPPDVQGLANPLVQHPLALPSRISGWAVDLPETFEAFRATLSSSMRDQMGKATRRFARVEEHDTRLVETPDEAFETLKFLETHQEIRLGQKGLDYVLSEPAKSRFYHRLAQEGVANGKTVMATFRVKGELVAANFGICEQNRVYYLRLTNLYGEWSPFKLGLLVTEYLIRTKQEQGITCFDFTLGDYDYKKRFGATQIHLHDVEVPLSWRGWSSVLNLQIRRRLRNLQWLRRLTGRDTKAAARGA